jgi:mannose-6-phosphate isomerase-like protein (cupin superfamily)
MPTGTRPTVTLVLMLGFALLAGDRAPARTDGADGQAVRFVPAAQLLSDVRAAASATPGLSTFNYLDTSAASAVVVRRTAAAKAEFHKDVVDVLYVVEGGGTLVTGGTLSEPVEGQASGARWQSPASAPNELRSAGIEGGARRQLAKGDFVVIPPSTPHWISAVDKEIVYLAIKVPPGR